MPPRAVEERRLAPALTGDAAARRHFVQTACILRRLQHPHIAAIYSVDERGNPPSYRVECLRGDSLASLAIAAGGFPVTRAVQLLRPLCAAVDALHDEGLLCRRLENQALLEPSGRVVLRETGIAPACPGEVAGVEDDIRGLGALACTLITGEAPPPETAVAGVLLRARRSPPPAAACAAILMALAPDPAARPPSASAFLALFDGSWPLSAAALAVEPLPAPAAPAPIVTPATGELASPEPRLVPVRLAGTAQAPPIDRVAAAAAAPAPARRRRDGWTTNAVAALMWVATVAGVGAAVVHYAGGRGNSRTYAIARPGTPAPELSFPAVPGFAERAPTATPAPAAPPQP